jgi:hypothetical protein
MNLHPGPKRVFLEVDDPGRLAAELASERGAFVPTRMPVSLGDRFMLAARLTDAGQAVELPVRVLGRRIARAAHGPLSTGVVVQLEDPAHPMASVLREVAASRANPRAPVRAVFPSVTEALDELDALCADGEGQLPVVEAVARGDRLAVTIEAAGIGPLLSFQVVVKQLIRVDERRLCTVALQDGAQRRAIEAFLELSRVATSHHARAPRSGET